MDDFKSYEFCVEIWHEDGEWNYSVIQEFGSDEDLEVEPLTYGTTDSFKEATAAVSAFVAALNFES